MTLTKDESQVLNIMLNVVAAGMLGAVICAEELNSAYSLAWCLAVGSLVVYRIYSTKIQ